MRIQRTVTVMLTIAARSPVCLPLHTADNRAPHRAADADRRPATRAAGRRSRAEVSDSILQRVARGETGAVQECLDTYGGLVWSLARRFSPTRADAEDATQDVFLDVWRSAARFNPEIAGEATFIAMIARRRLIDRLNKQRRRISAAGLPEGVQPPAPNVDNARDISDEAAVAAAALSTLGDDQQRVLRLSIHEGYTHAQIAEITDLPLGTVKTHIRRGLLRVRDLIDQARESRGVTP